jgi:death-on-curing protein
LEIEKLDGVLNHIQNDDYYPSFDTKLTHLFFCACKFHCYEDGNKRIAITLCAQMLLLNGYLRSVNAFIRDSENISYHVAAGTISKELLGEWMRAILNGQDDDESLKLKIYQAISGDTQQT